MSFAGKVWRLLVGIKDALSLLFLLLFFGLLFAVLSMRPSAAEIRDGALLLDLSGVVVEEVSPIDPFDALLASEAPTREFAARELVRAIDAARDDVRIKAIVLDLDAFLGGGQAHLTEIGEALVRFKGADKPVLSYATAYTDSGMLLAAHGSEIWMDPMGGAVITGPGGKNLYFADLLEKIGVNARVFKTGEFKSAGEPYSRNSMSEEARRNAEALYGALWEEWQASFRKARPQANIDLVTTDPAAWLTASQGDLGEASLAARLVDKLASRTEFEAHVATLVGENIGEGPEYAHTALSPWLVDNPAPTAGSTIGIVTIAGTIVDGDAGPGTAGGARIAQVLDDALDDGLAGLVVRVDSPGGSALASETIRQAILRHKANDIPIAVSMGNVAASGGYWVSMPAGRIFAEPETITGSIGVIAIVPTFEPLAQRLGVNSDGVTLTPLAGQPDFVGGFNEVTEEFIQGSIEANYRGFLKRVAEGRNITTARADQLGGGRVYDGGTARQLGLIDQYGGLAAATEWVAGQAGLGEDGYHTVNLGWDGTSYDTLLLRLLGGDNQETVRYDVTGHMLQRRNQDLVRLNDQFQMLLAPSGAQAMCLECSSAVVPKGQSRATGWLTSLLALLD